MNLKRPVWTAAPELAVPGQLEAHALAARVTQLGDDFALGCWRAALERGREAAAVDVFRDRQAHQVQHGRHHVDETHQPLRAARCHDTRPAEGQGDVEDAVVEALSVSDLAVLAELVAVVGGHDDDRVIRQAELGEALEQGTENAVRVLDLAQVHRAELQHCSCAGDAARCTGAAGHPGRV
jgi:hypothetical protein